MSSDEEPVGSVIELSDNEVNNEHFDSVEALQNQEEQTEEVQRDETAEGEGGGEDEEGEKKKVKPKRAVRNPLPKLNEETLKGPRGIAAIESYFQRVKFKGKGHEHQDLDVIMKTYEYWCHRLFPKFPFDTCIERLEKLGTKRAVQTHLRRIRFDLLVEDKPLLSDSDDEPNVEGFVDIQNEEINQQQNQQFEQLLSSSTPAAATTASATQQLTEEQLERIRLNKEKAERIKQERLKKIRDKAAESLLMSRQIPESSGMGQDTGSEQLEFPQNTQSSDGFSQQDIDLERELAKNQLKNRESLFDHESSVKGKLPLKGTVLKKKSNKESMILNSDSEKEDENIEGINKIINKRNTLLDSDSDEVMVEEIKDNNEKSNSLLSNVERDSSDDENSVLKKPSYKKRPKRIALRDSDDSDEEYERNSPRTQNNIQETGKSSKTLEQKSDDENLSMTNLSVKKRLVKPVLDSDESDQEISQSIIKQNVIQETEKTNTDLDVNPCNQIMDTGEILNGDEHYSNGFGK